MSKEDRSLPLKRAKAIVSALTSSTVCPDKKPELSGKMDMPYLRPKKNWSGNKYCTEILRFVSIKDKHNPVEESMDGLASEIP